ncbi:uncharacterized protein LOC122031362 [Zingiber officinale]|uniref:uncharacterized protein LOC122031362 n=1 Tax=Zingiber officinale TaxID=94328 RepID=UPI001C4CCAD7|nr:uncharacterized protein LOC122031362 [Zingiber officinale]
MDLTISHAPFLTHSSLIRRLHASHGDLRRSSPQRIGTPADQRPHASELQGTWQLGTRTFACSLSAGSHGLGISVATRDGKAAILVWMHFNKVQVPQIAKDSMRFCFVAIVGF